MSLLKNNFLNHERTPNYKYHICDNTPSFVSDGIFDFNSKRYEKNSHRKKADNYYIIRKKNYFHCLFYFLNNNTCFSHPFVSIGKTTSV